MKAMQHATGASDEQIQASTQMMANMKPGDFGSASITELQTVYLGLQNSGAFDSQDELNKAFRGFVRKQRDSGARLVYVNELIYINKLESVAKKSAAYRLTIAALARAYRRSR